MKMKQVSKLCGRDRARAAAGHRQSRHHCWSCRGGSGHRWSCGGGGTAAAVAVGCENAKSVHTVGCTSVTRDDEPQNYQFWQQSLKMYKSL